MSGQGPAPKDPATRRRRNKDSIPATVVSADGQIHGPELPESAGWHPSTILWWEVLRKSPQSQLWTDTDWSFLIDTAFLHTRMWKGDFKIASEVRLRVAKFGATPEDRLRLRLQVPKPNESEPSTIEVSKTGRYGHLRKVD